MRDLEAGEVVLLPLLPNMCSCAGLLLRLSPSSQRPWDLGDVFLKAPFLESALRAEQGATAAPSDFSTGFGVLAQGLPGGEFLWLPGVNHRDLEGPALRRLLPSKELQLKEEGVPGEMRLFAEE